MVLRIFLSYNSSILHNKEEDRCLYTIRLLHMVLCPFACFSPCCSPRKEIIKSEQSNRIQEFSKYFLLVKTYCNCSMKNVSKFCKAQGSAYRAKTQNLHWKIAESCFKDFLKLRCSLGLVPSNKNISIFYTMHKCIRIRISNLESTDTNNLVRCDLRCHIRLLNWLQE